MRLIDADKYLEKVCTYKETGCGSCKLQTMCPKDALTVDAEPVRHGRWIEVDVGDCCYRCSECGFIRDAYLLDISNYCPNCGAKMDGKENG